MKYIPSYVETAQNALFKRLGAFIGSKPSIRNIQQRTRVEYVRVGGELYVPSENVNKLIDGMQIINSDPVARDLKENSMAKIMQREFESQECKEFGDCTAAIIALADYGFSVKDFEEQWKSYCNRENMN